MCSVPDSFLVGCPSCHNTGSDCCHGECIHFGFQPQASNPRVGWGLALAQYPDPLAGQFSGLHLNEIPRVEIPFLAQARRQRSLHVTSTEEGSAGCRTQPAGCRRSTVDRAYCPVARGASMDGAWRRPMLLAEGPAGCRIQPAGCRRSPVDRAYCPVARGASMGSAWRRPMLLAEYWAGRRRSPSQRVVTNAPTKPCTPRRRANRWRRRSASCSRRCLHPDR